MTRLSTTHSSHRLVWGLSAVSALLLAAQLWIVGRWAAAVSERAGTAVSDFRSPFPGALAPLGAGTVTGLCVILAMVGASAALVAQSNALGHRRLLPRGLLAANGLLAVWYAFTLL